MVTLKGLSENGWPLILLTQPHDIFFQLHSARTSVQLLVPTRDEWPFLLATALTGEATPVVPFR